MQARKLGLAVDAACAGARTMAHSILKLKAQQRHKLSGDPKEKSGILRSLM